MDELRYFTLTGNIVHTIWFKTIRRANGNAYLLAVNVLAEIVYWYKPVEVRDEQTGQHMGWRNKYAADLLQKSYEQLANLFGVSKGQVKEAIIRLEELGVVERVFRDIPSKGLYNVMFLKLNVARLKELSELDDDSMCVGKVDTPLSEKPHPPIGESTPHCLKKDTPLSENPHTYTEITTKITTEITTENTNIHTYIPTDGPKESTQAGHECRADPIAFYKNNYCVEKLPKVIEEKILEFKQQGIEDSLICLVIQNAVERGKAWNYAKQTLSNLVADKCFTIAQYKANVISFRNKKGNSSGQSQNVQKFNNIYSHNWDYEELERLEREYVEQQVGGQA